MLTNEDICRCHLEHRPTKESPPLKHHRHPEMGLASLAHPNEKGTGIRK